MTDVETLAAHHEIRECLLSYCRGIDRLDPDLVAAAFHPEADLADYGPDPLTIELFVAHAMGSLEKKFTATQHRITNTNIALDGDRALVETYVLAFHIEATDDGDRLHTFNGRYIDRFERRDGSWKIAQRTLRNDWSKVEPITETMSGAWQQGSRDRTDISY